MIRFIKHKGFANIKPMQFKKFGTYYKYDLSPSTKLLCNLIETSIKFGIGYYLFKSIKNDLQDIKEKIKKIDNN